MLPMKPRVESYPPPTGDVNHNKTCQYHQGLEQEIFIRPHKNHPCQQIIKVTTNSARLSKPGKINETNRQRVTWQRVKAKTMAAVAMTGHAASMSNSPAVACGDGPALMPMPIMAKKYIGKEMTDATHAKIFRLVK